MTDPYRTPDPPKGRRWGATWLARVYARARGSGSAGHWARKMRCSQDIHRVRIEDVRAAIEALRDMHSHDASEADKSGTAAPSEEGAAMGVGGVCRRAAR